MHTIDEQIQLLCKNCRKSLKNVEVSKSLDLNKKKDNVTYLTQWTENK